MLVILMAWRLKSQSWNTHWITQKCVNSLNGSARIYSLSISVVYSFIADYQVAIYIYLNKYVHVCTVHFNLLILLICNFNNFVTLAKHKVKIPWRWCRCMETCRSTYGIQNIIYIYIYIYGSRGSLVLKELRYKPAGRGFDSRWNHWNFSVT
jgi:hypothetical protein